MIFHNRSDAGKLLGFRLQELELVSPIILGIPRGGIPVAHEVAKILHAPLVPFIVRKLGAPNNPEMGIGAVAEGGVYLIDDQVVKKLKIKPKELRAIKQKEQEELARRAALYHQERKIIDLKGKTVVIVDDGLATGITMRAAIKSILKFFDPARTIIAVPVTSQDAMRDIVPLIDDFVCLFTPFDFQSVGQWYSQFEQVTDQEVLSLLGS